MVRLKEPLEKLLVRVSNLWEVLKDSYRERVTTRALPLQLKETPNQTKKDKVLGIKEQPAEKISLSHHPLIQLSLPSWISI